MSNINVVVIEGNLTKAAELSHWTDGTPYCKFTIANNESYKDQNGQWQDVPSFFECMCKGPYAESMTKHLLKGRRITVYGRLKQTKWSDEQGNKHFNIVVKVSEISLAPFGNNSFRPNVNNQSQQQSSENYEPESYGPPPAEDNYSDSGIPF